MKNASLHTWGMWVFGVCTVERFASYWFFRHISALNAQISSTRSLRFCLQLMRQMTSLSGIFCLFDQRQINVKDILKKKKAHLSVKEKLKVIFYLLMVSYMITISWTNSSLLVVFFWKVPKRKSALWCKKNWTWRTFKCYLNLWQNLIMSCSFFFPVYEGGSQLTPTIMATKSSCHSAETFNTVYCFRT